MFRSLRGRFVVLLALLVAAALAASSLMLGLFRQSAAAQIGRIAGAAMAAALVPSSVASALLLGVDLGPNLSVTGSLATILWLMVLRREGQHVDGWTFLKLGAVAMPVALLLALAALLLAG